VLADALPLTHVVLCSLLLLLLPLQHGIVTDIWLWHGAFIDVLADFKG
jgi:hypothetical protein